MSGEPRSRPMSRLLTSGTSKPKPHRLAPLNGSSKGYPVIQQRGFYSDLVTNQAATTVRDYNQGPYTIQSLSKKVMKEDHTPIVAKSEEAILAQLYKEAHDEVKTITAEDMGELKTLPKAPSEVRKVFEAACVLLEIKPKEVKISEDTDEVRYEWWEIRKSILADPNDFLKRFAAERDSVPDKIIKELKPRIRDEIFMRTIKSNSLIEKMRKFILALYNNQTFLKYHKGKVKVESHGPTTQIIKATDFTEESYKPKVQLQYVTPPGQIPRKIEVERRKRKYAEANLPKLLEERNIDIDRLIPKDQDKHERVKLNNENSDPAPFPPYLPLHIFDDEEFDTRSPENWLSLGYENGIHKPVPGRAYLILDESMRSKDPKSIEVCHGWFNVGVLGYNFATKLWLVQKCSRDGRVIDTHGKPVLQGAISSETDERVNLSTQYEIPRIFLNFCAEDPQRFADRITFAFRHRKRTEALIRHAFYVDCMPMEGLPEIDASSLRKIVELARSTINLEKNKRQDDTVHNLEKEIHIDYFRAMNSMIFEKQVEIDPARYAFVTLPEKPKIITKKLGCVPDVPKYDFDDQYDKFAFVSLITKAEPIEAVVQVRGECNKVAAMSLYHIPITKPMKIDEFETTQTQATSQVNMYLRDSWIKTLRASVRTCFRDVGKGWFNLREKNWEVYLNSKMKKLMEMIKFMMQDTLRFLVQDSLSNLTEMVTEACDSIINCEQSMEWPENLIHSDYVPKKYSIFALDLVIGKDSVHYSTPLGNYAALLVTLFDKGIGATDKVQQLEMSIMEDMYWSEVLLLETVGIHEPPVDELRDSIKYAMEKAIIPMVAYTKRYYVFIELMNTDVNDYIKNIEEEGKSPYDMKALILEFNARRKQIEKIVPSSIKIGPYAVNTDLVRKKLIKKCTDLAQALLDCMARALRKQADDACEDFRQISRKLYEKPNCIEELAEQREWMASIPQKLRDSQDIIQKCMTDYELLDEFLYGLSQDDFNVKWNTVGWPYKIENLMEQTYVALEEMEEAFQKLQLSDASTFNDKLDTLQMGVASLSAHSDIGRAHEVANECRRLNKQLKEAQELAVKYNNRERLFNIPVTNYDRLTKLIKEFEPFRNLWLTVSDWVKWYESWMNDPLTSINAEELEKNVNDSYKTMHKSVRLFGEIQMVQDVAVTVKSWIEKFRPYIPLIQGLRNPGMRHRHWELLSEDLGFPLFPKANLTFDKCLKMNLQDHIEKIAKVAEVAGKEYSIEQALNKMEDEWKPIVFEVLPYKETGTYIIKITDEMSQLLDDHIVMTQSMSFSPYKKPFEDRISTWESKLRTTQDVLDEWAQCQRSWLYLEPIFSSDDINRQLPVESKRYQTMERMWRKVMKGANENPQVINLCPDNRLLESLRECNKLLDQVQKGLSEYLETKRMSFPRFYFLSDDELLEILSQTKDPTAVQPHLRKCFENIAKVRFEEDLEITQMFSAEGEKVDFKETMYPTGNVEDWMLEMERIMRETIRITLGEAIEDYPETSRPEWVLKWPGQIVIAGCQTFWTSEVSSALEQAALSGLYPQLLSQLDDLRKLVRGKLSRIGRMILSALIVIEVHARDVVTKMIEENVAHVNAFEWISQLRYYWNDDNEFIRAVNAEFLYGYEYLGNTGRLVITPLTDRCYLTLTGALHLKFGGAPAGPAGTGKTETTKDLGKAMAIQCVVFNCSDQLDFMAMGKFFKGLASAGAWACFDEFNRIDIEVLSVVAQQITTIQKAQQQSAERFLFEGAEIVLKASCAVFITMNPGYAGRTELPDNLKALFRPVAMMVPDYALIAEISLFSFGFSNAKNLAKKIVTTFKLSSEQLSSQDHYDFGMRAVKSVISAAGNLKRQNPDMDEELIALRAIRDVNVPKFLMDDLKLFNGIVSDLFPNTKQEPIDYGALDTSLRKTCSKMNLKDVDGFIHKCIQLYETTVVRHGLMLVGPTGSGKTKCYQVLRDAQTALKGEPSPAGENFETTHTYVLNPKSITMGQLYGEFDLMTHEWTDGILSSLIRIGSSSTNEDKRWYLFDGPVDAVWIENMNTVLDDNKKLCLSSGEIIKLTEFMTMMFEVQDLAVASPATVSRCGMVYLEPSILGLEPFVHCWVRKLPDPFYEHREIFQKLCDQFLIPAIEFVRENVKEIVGTMDSNLTFSLFKMIECFFKPFHPNLEKGEKELPADRLEFIPALIESWFIFSLIWTVGATGDNDGRRKFNIWLKDKMKEFDIKNKFPEEGSVYEYKFDDGGITVHRVEDEEEEEEEQKKRMKLSWKLWMADIPELQITPEMNFSDIIVPTVDSVSASHIFEMLLTNHKTLLAVGPTGTGKTLTMANKLTRGMPKEFIPEFIVFSAKTTANQTQDLIDGKLDKRRKGVFGPPLGRYFIFFIDDLNMPALETYGAQPPIELIRQWMDFKGWYDRKAIGDFRNLVDVNFACAMGPPGGGRSPISARLQRHFNTISFIELEDASKHCIFGTILNFWLSGNLDLHPLCEKMVKTCISVYDSISTQLLPTPAKSHYTFNLRDLSKVFQGILMVDVTTLKEPADFLRLWYHESCRVYQDRLVNDQDREWFHKLLAEKMTSEFETSYDNVVTQTPVLYGDFMHPNTDSILYEEITDHKKIVEVLEEYLEDYNQINTKRMDLVLFMDACRHICRICRIIRQPLGNALLLGMGGSGRQSLTRLAAHITDYDCFQIELSKNYGVADWREDLRQVMLKAGLQNNPTVFLFSDTQIKNESFLEDLNNILNAGDVPNIYGFDELDQIYTAMKPVVQDAGLQATKTNLYSTYTKRVRSNLHTVITMSPIGEVFRARLRQFPALVNCCTIDWFSEWPKDALESVAMRFLQDDPNIGVEGSELMGLVEMCQEIHQTVVEKSTQFKHELNRTNYVTPTSYLELLGLFIQLLAMKNKELVAARDRTAVGLTKLLATSDEVAKLQEELERTRPMLEEAVKESMETMKQIEVDTKVAEETKVVVQKEETEASAKAAECKAIADDAQKDLNEALPALDAAVASLKTLNRNDIVEVRAMQRPPDGVRMVVEAVCIMKTVKPKRVAGDKPGVKVDDYWEPGKSLLQDPGKFLDSLYDFDKDNIAEETIKKIQPFMENENFLPDNVAKVSKACKSICLWVRAMHKYHFIAKGVAPKREALRVASEDLQRTQAVLAEAKARLSEVEDGIATLQSKFDECQRKKEELENKCRECEERLVRADKLIGGLADEKGRWEETVNRLDTVVHKIIGDVMICAGFVAYLGPFTGDYRQSMTEHWISCLDQYKVPHTENPNLLETLSDPVKVREWQIAGLPKDNLSIENGVIVEFSRRWPLFIDPQGQANKWVKNLEKDNGLDVIKLSERDFLRSLENAVRFGKPCLLENVGEELDPALEPILLKQTYKQSGSLVIKLGDAIIPYHEDFKFYITTKLPNPVYTPDISTKVTLVNFTLSPSGLEDQLLGLVVAEERPDLEEAKNQLIISNAKMKSELKEIEDKILFRLSSSEGSPVDDIDLIQTLEASKIKSQEIKAKVVVAEQTEKDIDQTRSVYLPVAVNTQIMFFCVADLANIDPMYQYSLEWFISIFLAGIANAERCENVEKRIQNINEYFTFSLYSNVCRSLFEKHKLLFSFLLVTRILMHDNKLDLDEWRYLLSGGTHISEELPNPAPDWLTTKSWQDILTLSSLTNFKDLARDFPEYLPRFKHIFDSVEPENEKLPAKYEDMLDDFQKILVLRCLRTDKVTNAMQNFVSNKLGQKFIEPQTADLSVVYKDSSPTIPLIFILSAGTDPAAALYKFAEDMRFAKKLNAISLGQGQGPLAEQLMRVAMERGKWVFFQNCHLAPSWMPSLERLIEQIEPDKVHRDFRLWLTSMPSPKFPVFILQNGSKMTIEPPKGIKANLLKSYTTCTDDFLNSCKQKTHEFKTLLFSLSLFHAVSLERRKYGALGFNIPYEFTDGDLRICISQLKMFLMEYTEIPYKVLKYTAGHINYGGRVTDDWDRRCLMNILECYYFPDVLDEEYKYSQSGVYHQLPSATELKGYIEYIRSLPINDTPEIFGLHENANITFAQNETYSVLNGLVQLQPKSGAGAGGQSQEEVLDAMAKEILEEIPKPLDLFPIMEKYPVLYEQSMNTVIVQEVIRYNNLLEVILTSLADLIKALKGLVVLSQALEDMSTSLYNNMVPEMWSKKAYPSLKPLAAWVKDLCTRLKFIKTWVDDGIPIVFWISGFFFPQAFLTGTLQNYARKEVVSIDLITFGFEVLGDTEAQLKKAPENGCYIYGLFLEGAQWDPSAHQLTESKPKELFTEMPIIWLIPSVNRKQPKSGFYDCPVYKTLTRAGTLSTTGHSTNFVFAVEIPSKENQMHWIQRGVAMLCALNY